MAERKTFGAAFVAALVVLHRFLPLFPAWDAGPYPFVFQRFSEPVGIVAAVSQQPFHLWQTAHQSAGTDVIADLSCRDEEVERSALAVADGVQLRVHAALGPTNQASTPPFFTPMLVAVRWALR